MIFSTKFGDFFSNFLLIKRTKFWSDFFRFEQIWHFYCTLSRGLLFSGHSVVKGF